MSESVLVETTSGVTWITINRPEANNALNRAVRAGLYGALTMAEDDVETKVIVLTGAGDRAFSAGGDLREMAETDLKVPPVDYVPQPNRNMSITKPVIAAVNGFAFAGGFLLAQSADLVVATTRAQFAITEARVGRGAPWAASLSWLVPARVAMELLLTAQPITAERALEVGLVNRVVEPESLYEETQQLAETILANAPLSVAAGKRMIYATAEYGRTEAFRIAEEIWEPVYLSRDASEGPKAFAERRRPEWQGR